MMPRIGPQIVIMEFSQEGSSSEQFEELLNPFLDLYHL